MARRTPVRQSTTAAVPHRWRSYRKDVLYAIIESGACKSRRPLTKRQVRNQVKKNSVLLSNPLGSRHRMGINNALNSLVEFGIINCEGGENDSISWTANGKERLRVAGTATNLGPRDKPSQGQLIRMSQLVDDSSCPRRASVRLSETKAELKARNGELQLEVQQLQGELRQTQQEVRELRAELWAAQQQLYKLEIESVENQLYGPLTPEPDPDMTLVNPGGDEDDGQTCVPDSGCSMVQEDLDMNEISPSPRLSSPSPVISPPPMTPPPASLLPPPAIHAPRPLRPGLTASGSWIDPMSKQPSPAPTQAPGDDHDNESGDDAMIGVPMVGVDGADDSDEEETRQPRRNLNSAPGQLPTPDNTPVRPSRSQSHQFFLPSPPVVTENELKVQGELVDREKEMDELKGQMMKKSAEVAELESRLLTRDKQVGELTTERIDIQAQLNAEIQTWKAAKKASDRTIDWVKGKNLALHKEKLKLKRKIGDLEDEIERKDEITKRWFMDYSNQGPPKKRKRVSV